MGYLYQLCENCIFADEPSDKEPCRKCIRAFLAARTHKPQTNADRFRAMSDEELAKIIGKNIDCKICKNMANTDGLCPGSIINGEPGCYDVWLKWLKKEVE